VDRFGAFQVSILGLVVMVIGSTLLPMLPIGLGVAGYIAPLVLITAGYALFQAANNTAVMTTSQPNQRGVISGMLNLSRNLGLITGASVMGAVFAFAAGTTNILTAPALSVVAGMRLTFSVAVGLLVLALAIGAASEVLSRRAVLSTREHEQANASV
jgi:MFS family permease